MNNDYTYFCSYSLYYNIRNNHSWVDIYNFVLKSINVLILSLFYTLSTLDINTTLSTVLPKSHKAPDSYINVTVAFGHGDGMIPLDNINAIHNKLTLNNIAQRAEAYKPKPRTTYKMLQEYILEKYSFKVHTAYIAEAVFVKRVVV